MSLAAGSGLASRATVKEKMVRNPVVVLTMHLSKENTFFLSHHANTGSQMPATSHVAPAQRAFMAFPLPAQQDRASPKAGSNSSESPSHLHLLREGT